MGVGLNQWAEDLLTALDHAKCGNDVFTYVSRAARSLDFDHCAYGLQVSFPLSRPKISVFNDYPAPWRDRYESEGYVKVDPTVLHCSRSRKSIVWSDSLFSATPMLWSEAREYGLRDGWAQSMVCANGAMGMLTIARSSNPLTGAELKKSEGNMRWLVCIANLYFIQFLLPNILPELDRKLTSREIEVLKWTGDGKTSVEIACILSIAVDTVNFHVKNAVIKLQASNKTAAVVKAVILGILY